MSLCTYECAWQRVALGPSPYKSVFGHSSLLPTGQHVPPVSAEDHRHQDRVSEPELRRCAGTVLWALPAESLRGGRESGTAGPGRSSVGIRVALAKGSLQVGLPGPFVGDQSRQSSLEPLTTPPFLHLETLGEMNSRVSFWKGSTLTSG